MPNVGPLELVMVMIIALLVLGPQRLPEVGRSIGRGMREFRGALRDGGDDDLADENDDLPDEVDDDLPDEAIDSTDEDLGVNAKERPGEGEPSDEHEEPAGRA